MSITSRSPLVAPAPGGRKALPARVPPFAPGMRIGLFGGTFNPPHEGHRLVSLTALKRLQLDAVWWLVTPGNPLKNNSSLPLLGARMEAARGVANHPRVIITGIEAEIGVRYTYDTLSYLRRRCPGVHFVWLMGADNLASFHRWQKWREIADLMPIAVIDRPHSTLRAANGKAAHVFANRRVREQQAPLLASRETPAFVFLYGPRADVSSTELRRQMKLHEAKVESELSIIP